MTYAAHLPDRAAVPALLRAALAGDEEGARVIVDGEEDLRPLVFALVAWCTTMHGGKDFSSVEECDDYLARVLAAMRNGG